MYSIPYFKDLVYWFTVIYTLTIKYLESETNLKQTDHSIRKLHSDVTSYYKSLNGMFEH